MASILIDARAAFMPYAPSAHAEHDVRSWVQGTLVPSGGVTVAVRDGTVVAVMVTRVETDCAWIDQMYVTPSQVGKGIGTELMKHALARLPRPVRLHSFQENAGARRFYERHGFRPIEFTDGHANEEQCPDVLYECRGVSSSDVWV